MNYDIALQLGDIMQVRPVQNLEELKQLFQNWPSLGATSAMQSPDWLWSWCEAFLEDNSRDKLYCLVAFDQDVPVAVLPTYRRKSWLLGSTLRWIGDEVTCSDHCSILLNSTYEKTAQTQAIAELANWLKTNQTVWDRIHLEAIDQDDACMALFVGKLDENRLHFEEKSAEGSAAIELPNSMEDYLGSLTRNHRKRCRKWLRRYFDSGRIQIEEIVSGEKLEAAWQDLLRLHRERRQVVGDETAFDQSHFCQFHRTLLSRWVPLGKASIRRVFLDDELVAVEYVLKQAGTIACYQSGMLTRKHGDGFGNLSILALIRDAITQGYETLDLLRGEEGYKSHWQATTRHAYDLVVLSDSLVGKLQYKVESVARKAKGFLKGRRVEASENLASQP